MNQFLCTPFYPSFWADLFIAVFGGILSLAAGYAVYIVSIRKTRKDRLKYVSVLINQIIPSATKQGEYCLVHATKISDSPYTENHLQLEANRDTKRLADKVDQEGVYHAYLWKYGRNKATYASFHGLYALLDYLDAMIDDMLKTNEKIIMYTWERKKDCQILYRKIREKVQSLSFDPEIIATQHGLVDHLLELLDIPQPQGENLVSSYTDVIIPMKDYVIENAQPHPKITELMFLISQMQDSYLGIEIAAKHNAEDYRYYGKTIQEIAEKLKGNSDKLLADFSINI